jgi:tRNA threonylcarbamoyl adenosine modification protein YeaZ
MRVLAVDTATPRVGAAYLDTDSGFAVERSELDPRRHAELLTPLITQVLAKAHVTLQDLDLIVTGVGPGPYTGLRVSVVTATTLGLVLGRPVVGVCTLDGFAHDAVRTGARPIVVATDARRREVYWAAYDDTGRRFDGPMVSKPDLVAARYESEVIGTTASHVRPDATDVDLRCGSLADVAIAALAAGVNIPTATTEMQWSDRDGDGSGSVPLNTLLMPRPLYLRHPDAQVPLAMRGVG